MKNNLCYAQPKKSEKMLKDNLLDIKKICCIGAGYVGGPTMAVIAEKCPLLQVVVLDINEKKIKAWNSSDLNKLPIFEPGLKEIISKVRDVNLFFSNEIEKVIGDSDMIFISVNTPTKTKGFGAGYAMDLKWVEASARQVAKYAKNHTIVVEKSTLPVKTAEVIKKILKSNSADEDSNLREKTFSILSNPEFLAEGTAIYNLQKPDRVLIGGEDVDSINALSSIYEKWVKKDKILTTNLWSSELSKLTANAFLAQKISSINSISAICEVTGAEVSQVSKAVGFDSRIGNKFLNSGPGFGGSCFKKDILNLVYLSKYYGLDQVADYWEQVIKLNIWQQHRISKLIVNKLFGTVTKKKIAILGFAFKANTNDTRESPAISIVKDLLENGAEIHIHDPKVTKEQIANDLKLNKGNDSENISTCNWKFSNDIYKVIDKSDAIVIITEWDDYKNLDWERISRIMRNPSWIFDTRSVANKKEIQKTKLSYWSIGDGSIN